MQNLSPAEYRELAATERSAAEIALLENVRQKHLTAAAAWDDFASTQERIIEKRAARIAAA